MKLDNIPAPLQSGVDRMDTMNRANLDDRILFAVPNQGTLKEAALELLQDADVQFDNHSDFNEPVLGTNLPVALIFLAASDIPGFVHDGHANLGITRSDQVSAHDARLRSDSKPGKVAGEAKGTACRIEARLDFGASELQLQVPIRSHYTRPSELVGSIVATKLVDQASKYWAQLDASAAATERVISSKCLGDVPRRTTVVRLRGNPHVICAVGIAQAIVDRVESGEATRLSGFRTIGTILESKAVLIRSHTSANSDMAKLISSRLCRVTASRTTVVCQCSIERRCLPEAMRATMSKQAPRTRSLSDREGWVMAKTSIEKGAVAVVMDQLTLAGAEDIVIMEPHGFRRGMKGYNCLAEQ